MGNLTRTDTEAFGRMRWAHADRTSLRGSRDPRSRDRVRPFGEVSREEKMALRGTDPVKCQLVYLGIRR